MPREVFGQPRTGENGTGFATRSWTTEDGLPVNQVVDLRQTPDGYLWLATFGGLVRFDGNDFRVYDAADYPTLPSSRFRALEVAPDGAVIAQTEFGHVARLADGRFSMLVPGPGLEGATRCVGPPPHGRSRALLPDATRPRRGPARPTR